MININTNFYTGDIPQKLRDCPTWLCYRKDVQNENRTAKIPINPHNGLSANITSKHDCGTFQLAIEACKTYRLDGLGFAFFAENNFVGIDIDHCLTDGHPSALAREVIDCVASYTEISPSESGIHIICMSTKAIVGKKSNTTLGLEIYSDKRYFTFTANIFENRNEISLKTEAIETITQKYMSDIANHPKEHHANSDYRNSYTLLDKAFASRNGTKMRDLYNGRWDNLYRSQSEADIALCNMLAFWSSKDALLMDNIFRSSKLYRPKWDTRRNGKTYGDVTINSAIDSCIGTYSSPITSQCMAVQLVQPAQHLSKWYSAKRGDSITFMPGILAQHIADQNNFIFADSYFYMYVNGVYNKTSDNFVSKLIQDNLLDEYSKSSHVKDTLDQLKNKIIIEALRYFEWVS